MEVVPKIKIYLTQSAQTVRITAMDISHLLNDLNDAQREAVAASKEEHLLVLAGAGSGKTRVLVQRIAWLIQVEQVSPYAIMAVTFTNKAAAEMRLRIEDILGIPVRGMWIGTFHSLCHRLLKTHWQAAGLDQHFQIIDSDDQQRLIKRLIKALELDDTRWPAKQAQWWISQQKEEGRRAKNIDPGADVFEKTMLRIYQAYENACTRGGLVDFSELLLAAHELWLKNTDLLAHYQQRLSYLLVDEFQDTNSIQYAWLRVLAGNKLNLMAVGDDDQSIYGWRGAKIENLQQLSKDFSPTKIIRLEQNYRSTGHILKAANTIISNNQNRLGKELWTDGEEGETIKLYAAYNEQDEARFVVECIQSLLKKTNISKNDIAVLYRSNAQSRVLEEAFLRHQMPYRIYGGLRFYERLEIKNTLAYLRLISNPNNDAAFERVINTPPRGIGSRTIEILRDMARNQNSSLWQMSHACIINQSMPARATTALSLFVQLIENLKDGAAHQTLEEIATSCVHDTGLMTFHKKEKGETGLARKENLEEFIQACADFETDDSVELTSLQQFLDNAALDAGDKQAQQYEESVQLMTLHSAKGLEFELVFLVGMEENLFPHYMSTDEPSGVEEERRLCYVGITRAKKYLYMSYAEVRRLYGNENYNPASRFIHELPAECIEELRLGTQIKKPLSTRTRIQPTNNDTGFSLGQNVNHQKFGDGVIINFEGKGASTRVEVNFSEGKKWLVLQYANLS